MSYHQTNILLHEIVLHGEHPAEGFKPPFFIHKTRPTPKHEHKLVAPYIDAVLACVTSARAVCDMFLEFDIPTMRALPNLQYVILCYSVVVLAKFHISASNPRSEIGRLIESNDIAIESYVDSIIPHLEKAAGPESFRIPNTFLPIFNRLKEWYKRDKFPFSHVKDESGMGQPLLHLSLHSRTESISSNSASELAASPVNRDPRSAQQTFTFLTPSKSNSENSSNELDYRSNAADAFHDSAFVGDEYDFHRYPFEPSASSRGPQTVSDYNCMYPLLVDPAISRNFDQDSAFPQVQNGWEFGEQILPPEHENAQMQHSLDWDLLYQTQH